jgi:hypothetical protein
MTYTHVYAHAIDRWIERIDPNATREEAKAEILRHRNVIDFAARFGAPRVRLPNGAILTLDGANVVTVKRHNNWKHQTQRQRRQIRRRIGH